MPARPSFRKARYGGSKIDEEIADLKKKLAALEARKAEIEGEIAKWSARRQHRGGAAIEERIPGDCHQTEMSAVNRYDPSQTPDPVAWLELDEQDRVDRVEDYHRRARVDLPNPTLHATMHVIVENQLALDDEPVIRALARLRKAGLSRHDALHAIGSLVAEMIYDLMNLKDTAEASRARYYAAVERLDAAQWRNGSDG